MQGQNGSISPAGAVIVNYDSSQTFTFTPNTGYNVNQVLVDNVPVSLSSANSYTMNNVTAAHTIVVNFTSRIIITASAGTGGTISPSGTVLVNSGASQTFTVRPNSALYTAGSTVDGLPATLTNNTYTFRNLTVFHTIAVRFVSHTTLPIHPAPAPSEEN